MASNKTNRVEVPEAKAAMDRFKTEVASELGVNLKEGYNGDLTSKEAKKETENDPSEFSGGLFFCGKSAIMNTVCRK